MDDVGDELALRIIQLYQMHYKAPNDPGAAGLLTAAVNQYKNRPVVNAS